MLRRATVSRRSYTRPARWSPTAQRRPACRAVPSTVWGLGLPSIQLSRRCIDCSPSAAASYAPWPYARRGGLVKTELDPLDPSGEQWEQVRKRRFPIIGDVKDSAAGHGLSTHQEARFPREDLGAEQTGMNFLVIKPGQREAFAHRHRTAEEIYVVIDGAGRVKLDDELVELAPLDALRVSPGVARSFEAGPTGLQVLIFGPRVEADGEIVQDFWTD